MIHIDFLFSDFMYIIFLLIAMCCTYTALFFLFPFFFEHRYPIFNVKKSFKSMLIVSLCLLIVYAITIIIPNLWIANRMLHMFGGGFLAFVICFLAYQDSGTKITRFQFFLFSTLIVIALGVGNELVEFVLQNTTHLIFAPNINDTWLDLSSNLIGTLLAATCLVPQINRKKYAK